MDCFMVKVNSSNPEDISMKAPSKMECFMVRGCLNYQMEPSTKEILKKA